MSAPDPVPTPLAADLLWGADAIAAELGVTVRQARNLVATNQIPTTKIGGQRVASRSALRAHFAEILGGEASK